MTPCKVFLALTLLWQPASSTALTKSFTHTHKYNNIDFALVSNATVTASGFEVDATLSGAKSPGNSLDFVLHVSASSVSCSLPTYKLTGVFKAVVAGAAFEKALVEKEFSGFSFSYDLIAPMAALGGMPLELLIKAAGLAGSLNFYLDDILKTGISYNIVMSLTVPAVDLNNKMNLATDFDTHTGGNTGYIVDCSNRCKGGKCFQISAAPATSECSSVTTAEDCSVSMGFGAFAVTAAPTTPDMGQGGGSVATAGQGQVAAAGNQQHKVVPLTTAIVMAAAALMARTW